MYALNEKSLLVGMQGSEMQPAYIHSASVDHGVCIVPVKEAGGLYRISRVPPPQTASAASASIRILAPHKTETETDCKSAAHARELTETRKRALHRTAVQELGVVSRNTGRTEAHEEGQDTFLQNIFTAAHGLYVHSEEAAATALDAGKCSQGRDDSCSVSVSHLSRSTHRACRIQFWRFRHLADGALVVSRTRE